MTRPVRRTDLRPARAHHALLLVVAAAVTAACGGETGPGGRPASASSAASPTGAAPSAAPAPSSASQTPPPPPGPAGPSEAAAVAELPTGAGTGTVTITYSGLGEAASDFAGSCTHDGQTTTLSGTAGTATVDLVFDPTAVVLTVTDVGLGTSEASLGRADLVVSDGRLSLTAPLVAADQAIGSITADVTCSA